MKTNRKNPFNSYRSYCSYRGTSGTSCTNIDKIAKWCNKKIVKKDKPEGEIVFEDFYKVVYLFGFLIYKRKYDYELTFTGNSNKPGFK